MDKIKKNVSITLLTLISLFYTIQSRAQGNDEVALYLWTDVTLNYWINNKSRFGGDAGLRSIVSSKEWKQFYVRPANRFYINPFINVGGAVAFFSTVNKAVGNVAELRLAQEAHLIWPNFMLIDFFHRIRLEERFLFYQKDQLFNETLQNELDVRSRYQLTAESQDFHLFQIIRGIYLRASFEYFLPLNQSAVERFINQTRIVGGYGHRISEKFRYELQYIWGRSRAFKEDGLKTSENIIRLRCYYAWRSNTN